MENCVIFFPVDNGDMTLIKTKSNVTFMIDCNIRNVENDENIYDCNEYLQKNLPKDNEQPYLDAFLLTHSDNDHCRGISEYFNLCDPKKVDTSKIRIDELYVPARLMVDDEHYNDDADAIKKETKRRLDLIGTDEETISGNRIKIIGYSKKLEEYSSVIIPAGDSISKLNGKDDYGANIFILRPVKKSNACIVK